MEQSGMTEYIVRWKFGPNSTLNSTDQETDWAKRRYLDKEQALRVYESMKERIEADPDWKMTVELLEVTTKVLLPEVDGR